MFGFSDATRSSSRRRPRRSDASSPNNVMGSPSLRRCARTRTSFVGTASAAAVRFRSSCESSAEAEGVSSVGTVWRLYDMIEIVVGDVYGVVLLIEMSRPEG